MNQNNGEETKRDINNSQSAFLPDMNQVKKDGRATSLEFDDTLNLNTQMNEGIKSGILPEFSSPPRKANIQVNLEGLEVD
jgi:hypothetical protein